jgi:hypothetical protein
MTAPTKSSERIERLQYRAVRDPGDEEVYRLALWRLGDELIDTVKFLERLTSGRPMPNHKMRAAALLMQIQGKLDRQEGT